MGGGAWRKWVSLLESTLLQKAWRVPKTTVSRGFICAFIFTQFIFSIIFNTFHFFVSQIFLTTKATHFIKESKTHRKVKIIHNLTLFGYFLFKAVKGSGNISFTLTTCHIPCRTFFSASAPTYISYVHI